MMDRRTFVVGTGFALSMPFAGCLQNEADSNDRTSPDWIPAVDSDEALFLFEQFDVQHVIEYEPQMQELGFALDRLEVIVDDPHYTLSAGVFETEDLDSMADVATERPEGRQPRAHMVRGEFDAEVIVSEIESNMEGEPIERDGPGEILIESDGGGAVGSRDDAVVFGPDASVVESMLKAPGDETERYFSTDRFPSALYDGLEGFAGSMGMESETEVRVYGYEVLDSNSASTTARYQYTDREQYEEQVTETTEHAETAENLRAVDITQDDDELLLILDAELQFDIGD